MFSGKDRAKRPVHLGIVTTTEKSSSGAASSKEHTPHAWASTLQQPAFDRIAQEPERSRLEASMRFLYRGNRVGFGIATIATGISATAGALAAWTASHMGHDALTSAAIAAAVSYVWYPANFALNHFFRDRHIIRALEAEGAAAPRWRTWGSRVTQTVVGETVWLGLVIPAQVALVKFLGMPSGWAALSAHLPLALTINATLVTPYRNVSQWIWGLERGKNKGQAT